MEELQTSLELDLVLLSLEIGLGPLSRNRLSWIRAIKKTWHISRDSRDTAPGEEVQQGSMSIPEQREILLSKARDGHSPQMLMVIVRYCHPRTNLPFTLPSIWD
jgi:hypothetical protein